LSEPLVVIGEITRAHGLAGELRVTPLTDDPDRFSHLRQCVVWDEVTDARQWRRIVGARRAGDTVLVCLAGCESAEAAAALVGRLLAVPESEALPAPAGRIYPWQLSGCVVTTPDGARVGIIAGVQSSPAHDLWVVRRGGRDTLVPAVPDIVVEVDVKGRRVVIRPPEGLLDL